MLCGGIMYVGNLEFKGVEGMHRDTPKITTGRRSPADVSKVEIEGANPALIKAHGKFIICVHTHIHIHTHTHYIAIGVAE